MVQLVNFRRDEADAAWRAGLLGPDGLIALGPLDGSDGAAADEPALRAAERLRGTDLAEAADGKPVEGPVEFGPPVLRPGKIVAAAANYMDHVNEMDTDRGTIERQGFFLKAPSSLLAPGGIVRLPFPGRRTDYEGELAVVIGGEASNLSEEQALEAVLGYTCLLDISLRGEEDRGFRKSFDTFTPMGTGLVPRDVVPDLDACELTTTVDGEVRQHAKLSQMIYGVPRLLAWISSVMTLYPGDVVATGTPDGVGPLRAGEDLSVEITGVGSLSVTVADR